jgi:plastocyanin
VTDGRAGAGAGFRAGLRAACAVGLLALAGCGGRPHARLHHVVIHQFLYVPATLTVVVGDTVEWANRDIVPHTATATDRAWDSGDIQPGTSARVVSSAAGAYEYGCSYHTNMKAHLTASP